MQIVPERNAHVRLLHSILIRGYAGQQRDVFKFARAVALVQIIGLAVVGDKQIKLSRRY